MRRSGREVEAGPQQIGVRHEPFHECVAGVLGLVDSANAIVLSFVFQTTAFQMICRVERATDDLKQRTIFANPVPPSPFSTAPVYLLRFCAVGGDLWKY
jgi:hypothetical protein